MFKQKPYCVKPILYINKVDRLIFELKLTAEEIYQRLVTIINNINIIISTYKTENLNLDLSPELGNVFFGSAYHGWGFGLKQFAKMYAEKFGSDENKLMKQLWGKRYFDAKKKKMVTQSQVENRSLKRTFCKFILDLILDMITAIYNKEKEKYVGTFTKLGIKFNETELSMDEKDIYKLAMKRFLPLADSLLEGIINHLPSPKQAQLYRYKILYDGPLDDECAEAIRTCNENGPLVFLYI